MKNLFIILIVLFAASGCTDSERKDSKKNSHDVEEQYLEFDQEKENKWYQNNLVPLNENLIRFSISFASTEQFEELGNKYLKPNEKSENKLEFSEFKIEHFNDSTIVSFWKYCVLACGIQGNIEIQGGNVNLLFADICSPFTIPTDGEFALLNFKYVFNPNVNIISKSLNIKDEEYSENFLILK